MSEEVLVGLLLIFKRKKKLLIPNSVCNFIQHHSQREFHVVRTRVSVEKYFSDWKQNEKTRPPFQSQSQM